MTRALPGLRRRGPVLISETKLGVPRPLFRSGELESARHAFSLLLSHHIREPRRPMLLYNERPQIGANRKNGGSRFFVHLVFQVSCHLGVELPLSFFGPALKQGLSQVIYSSFLLEGDLTLPFRVPFVSLGLLARADRSFLALSLFALISRIISGSTVAE